MRYHDGVKVSVGDIFTTFYHKGVKQWKVITKEVNGIKIQDTNSKVIYLIFHGSDIGHWRLINKDRERTGFGKFIKRIEA